MFLFRGRYKPAFMVSAMLVFGWGSVAKLFQWMDPGGEGMDLFGAIIFGIMAIFKWVGIVDHYRKQKNTSD